MDIDDSKKKVYSEFFNSCTTIVPLSWIIRTIDLFNLDLNYQDSQGLTCIFHLIMGENYDIIEYILNNYKINLEIKSYQAQLTALHYACRMTDKKTIDLLLKHGSNLNAIDIDGNTPLLSAVKDGNYKVVYHLIKYGARIDATDKNGETILNIIGREEFEIETESARKLYLKISKLLWNIE